MLSLSQTSNSLLCIEWIPSESGPQVIQYKKISYKSKNYIDFLGSIFKNFKVKNSDSINKNLTLSLDLDNVCITSFKYSSQITLDEKIQWYEKNFLGNYILDNYDIYYYPMHGSCNEVMVIYISRHIKNNILACCNKYGYDLKHLTVDIFSANHSVHIYNPSLNDCYILWKIGKGNHHHLLYYDKENLKSYLRLKCGKKIECIQFIGSNKVKKQLISVVSNFMLENTKNVNNDFYDKIYLYQSKSNFQLLEKIYKQDTNKIIIMDIGRKFLNKSSKRKNNYHLLGYNENGNSLRGIDV